MHCLVAQKLLANPEIITRARDTQGHHGATGIDSPGARSKPPRPSPGSVYAVTAVDVEDMARDK
jgi:hypothetical protein